MPHIPKQEKKKTNDNNTVSPYKKILRVKFCIHFL